jgi:cell division transport system ATP-binding protein
VKVLKVDIKDSNEILLAKDILKIYPQNLIAVDHVNMSVNKGEFLFIMGKSGAGKSTLIKIISKQEEPDSGKIYIGKREITAVPRSQGYRIRRELGVVFQDFKLIQYKNVFENIAFALEVLGYKDKYVRIRTMEVLELVGLTNKARKFPLNLSGGEQQRIAIARAIVNQPLILFADEPTGNLDWETSFELMNLFLKINQEGTTIIMSTHNEDIIKKLKKRTLVIEKGKKIDEIFY